MNLSSRRIVAAIIDYFLIALIFVCIGFLELPSWFYSLEFDTFTIPSIGMLLLICCVISKDLMFKNASIGKKIMGLVIVDLEGSIPSATLIIKRGFIIHTIGYLTLLLHLRTNLDFVKWEAERIRTKIIKKSELNKK